jgi:hypothetical protein
MAGQVLRAVTVAPAKGPARQETRMNLPSTDGPWKWEALRAGSIVLEREGGRRTRRWRGERIAGSGGLTGWRTPCDQIVRCWPSDLHKSLRDPMDPRAFRTNGFPHRLCTGPGLQDLCGGTASAGSAVSAGEGISLADPGQHLGVNF